jgi:p-hydroxybenzoate 3-monooxygenase
MERTGVAIVGAGPAGLTLSHLLARAGIANIVLESRSREYVERRVRAGVLEQGTVDLLCETGVGERLTREGMVHHGIELRFSGERHRIPLTELAGGRSITVYGQQEVVKDLIQARLAAGGDLRFEAGAMSLHDLDTPDPIVRYERDGQAMELQADFIAGCDGFHGISRPAVPPGVLTVYDHTYPFAWLGVLAAAAPAVEEVTYAYHERGFALYSLRSPEVSRLYLQVRPNEELVSWPEERIWQELRTRLATHDGAPVNAGPIMELGITAMRSYVVEPMQYGRLFLAGDAAHIVPPNGAKGLNLAVADVKVLAAGLTEWFGTGRAEQLDAYSTVCLRRVWRAQHFSWFMTSLLHRFETDDLYQQRLQQSQLRYVTTSKAAATSLAENYVGLVNV